MTWPTSVADRISSPGGTGPRRSARRRTWWADSSADTSRTRWPAAARAARTWSSSVDLPMPGFAPEQGDRSGHQAPGEHPVELLHAGRDGRRLRHVHRGQGHGHTRQVELVDGPHQRARGPPPRPGCSTRRRSGTARPSGRSSSRSRCSGGAWPSLPSPDGRDRVCHPVRPPNRADVRRTVARPAPPGGPGGAVGLPGPDPGGAGPHRACGGTDRGSGHDPIVGARPLQSTAPGRDASGAKVRSKAAKWCGRYGSRPEVDRMQRSPAGSAGPHRAGGARSRVGPGRGRSGGQSAEESAPASSIGGGSMPSMAVKVSCCSPATRGGAPLTS